ncbi:hypothetical protein [Suttonella ornithocola]|uniref:hypothetical protein n=1 Tax=Suttonella ornithocola TaxID=279832 RepID=UPI001B805053|nr:hypothetical protein [Suttonella ornithocola]
MAYSSDYRQMILTKLKEGASFRELAEEYQLSSITIQRWKINLAWTWIKSKSVRNGNCIELAPYSSILISSSNSL